MRAAAAATTTADKAPSHLKPALPEDLRNFARQLRQGSTDAEQWLWQILRDRRMAGAKFRRQHPLQPYVLDFYCHERKLAIELDGGQHNDGAARVRDQRRTAFLEKQGIRVLRFWNNAVFQHADDVLEAIFQAVVSPDDPLPSPPPSPDGRKAGMRAARSTRTPIRSLP